MAKPNPLQEQLLKAGLVKKSKVAEAAREQHKARHGKGPAKPSDIALETERAHIAKVERDRAPEPERQSQARLPALRAQAPPTTTAKHGPGAADHRYPLQPPGPTPPPPA